MLIISLIIKNVKIFFLKKGFFSNLQNLLKINEKIG